VSGSWISPNRSEAGVPLLRYDIIQNGGTLSGEAFRRYEGALERVGPLSGSIDEEGEAHWVTTLNDNGWDGTETVDAQFSGVEVQSLRAASVALAVASSTRAGTVTGTWEWIAPDGTTVRDRSQVILDRTVVVALPAGSGALGEAGLWRGSMLYASLGACNATGFIMAISLSGGGGTGTQEVIGSVSGQPYPRGAELPATLDGWLGYLLADVSGFLLTGTEEAPQNTLSVELSGDIEGLLDGTLATGPTGTQWLGEFTGAKPCVDQFGPTTTGVFVLQSEQALVF